ncbi:MAG: energy transducer TonB [Terriglobia bacterium]|jgi:TonB family protein
MSTSNLQVEASPVAMPPKKAPPADHQFEFTFVETPTVFVSAFRQIRDWLREPKVTVPAQYYRGEARLPATDMAPWFVELPSQLRVAFEKPRDPIGIYNHGQQEKRALCAFALAAALGAAGWFWRQETTLLLGVIAGFALGELAGSLIFKARPYPPDIWHDFRMQKASWVNSVMVHTIALTLLLLPYILTRMWQPVKAATRSDVVDISPYLPMISPGTKKAGGGGGGGDRSPTPASKGAIPKFAKTQLAPPMAVIPNTAAQLQVAPTLVGPPELKLPQMSSNMNWGDPNGVVGPASNGPGFGGGIGSGSGGGIGSGKGGGLGPGEGGGVGGGVYSVGGGVSAPIPIFKPEPPYSEEARKAKYQGTVVLFIIVDTAGNVSECRVIKPLGLGLDEKAVETVKTWKFKPALRNGTPVPVQVTVEVSFRLF